MYITTSTTDMETARTSLGVQIGDHDNDNQKND